jgi:phosphatidylserine/phosphatidylglycerophosphate/cardiolipin synthase-like enzyme
MVIDGAVTLTGSMNWTRSTAVNSEDLNLISSPAVAAGHTGRIARGPARDSPPGRALVPVAFCRRLLRLLNAAAT